MVINETPCEQYFVVFGGYNCDCHSERQFHSAFITIAPMSNLFLDSAVLALPTTGFELTIYTGDPNENISGVRIVETNHLESTCGYSDVACTLSQPNCGAPLPYISCTPNPSFVTRDLDCEPCGWTIPTWYPDYCEAMARLVFN